MSTVPFIKTFVTMSGNYVYDVTSNSILRIKDTRTFEAIRLAVKHGIPEYESAIEDDRGRCGVEEIVAQGLLRSNDNAEIVNPMCELCQSYSTRAVCALILQVTQACNLTCSYCPYAWASDRLERSHTNRRMSWDTAKAAIDLLLLRSVDSTDLTLSFYGGEPLLEFPLIRRCVEYLEDKCKSKPLTFAITTNATLLNADVLQFISKRNFLITVSIDGPAPIHDRHRRYGHSGTGSFEDAYGALRLIAEDYPDIIDRVAINAVWNGIDSLDAINEFFKNDSVTSLFQLSLNSVDPDSIELVMDTSEENVISAREDLLKYVINELSQIDHDMQDYTEITKSTIVGFSSLNKRLSDRTLLPVKRYHDGPCMPGHAKLFVDVDGSMYPCEKASDRVLQFGNVHDAIPFNLDNMRTILMIADIGNERCRNCWGIRICGTCALHAANKQGFSKELLYSHCDQTIYELNRSLVDYIYLKEMGFDLGKEM